MTNSITGLNSGDLIVYAIILNDQVRKLSMRVAQNKLDSGLFT